MPDAPAPPVSHPGKVNFNVDMASRLVHVEVRRPTDILPTTVSIDVFQFLEIAATLQGAVNAQIRAAFASNIIGPTT